jgi:hypothetical protein
VNTDDPEITRLIYLQKLFAEIRDEHAHTPIKRARYAEAAMEITRLVTRRASELAREQMAVCS